MAGVAWVGASLALDGEISLGQVIAAAGVTQFMVGPLDPPGLGRRRCSPAPARRLPRLAETLSAPPAVPAPDRPGDAPSSRARSP